MQLRPHFRGAVTTATPAPYPARWSEVPDPGKPMRSTRLTVLVLPALLAGLPGAAAAEGPRRPNGFALEPAGVDVAEILEGGPPRDGIPALGDPAVVPAREAGLADDAPVLGVALGGEARAYPLSILAWHELVNDRLGGEAILVSYCPLCGTGMVFDRRVDGGVRTFGVSGLLYRSDLLLYDRETESLWSQILARAVIGPSLGERLRLIRAPVTTFGRWRRAHPGTTVLSFETGHRRNYERNPYGDYALSERLRFPAPTDDRYHPKMPTLGLRLADGSARAYPASEVHAAGGAVEEEFRGRRVRVAYDPEEQIFEFEAPDDVEVIEGFWFAWAAFHPETEVFVARGRPAPPAAAARAAD